MVIDPESMGRRPEIVLSSVDLPAPFEPMTVTKSDSSRVSESPWRALRSLTVPGKKVFEIVSMVSMAQPSLPAEAVVVPGVPVPAPAGAA